MILAVLGLWCLDRAGEVCASTMGQREGIHLAWPHCPPRSLLSCSSFTGEGGRLSLPIY